MESLDRGTGERRQAGHGDAGVAQPLPSQPTITEAILHSPDETFQSPEPLVDHTLIFETLHVDAIPHREDISQIAPPLHPISKMTEHGSPNKLNELCFVHLVPLPKE